MSGVEAQPIAPKGVVLQGFIIWWTVASRRAADNLQQPNAILRRILSTRPRVEQEKCTKADQEVRHRRTCFPLHPDVNRNCARRTTHLLPATSLPGLAGRGAESSTSAVKA